MSINAIKTNVQSLRNTLKTDSKVNVQEEKKEMSTQQSNINQKQVTADDVFKYMSASNPVSVNLRKSVNLKTNVDKTSAERIANSVQEFEVQFMAKLSSVKSEFGNISDSLAEKITLSMF